MKKIIGLGVAAGLLGGAASFAFARAQVSPLIGAAVGYEEARSHAEAELTGSEVHGHELFTRSVQENVGAGTGVVVFGVILGALFAVAFVTVSAYLARRGVRADGRWVATALAGAGFATVNLVPFTVYPANPPGVGLEDTMAARTTAYLTILLLSVGLAAAAAAIGVRLAPRLGAWAAAAIGGLGYLVAIATAAALLPRFHEVPGPLTDAQGAIAFPGFPAELLSDFRMQSVMATGVLWLVLGAAFAAFLPGVLTGPQRSRTGHPLEEIHADR